jgi:hypothetical protein
MVRALMKYAPTEWLIYGPHDHIYSMTAVCTYLPPLSFLHRNLRPPLSVEILHEHVLT